MSGNICQYHDCGIAQQRNGGSVKMHRFPKDARQSVWVIHSGNLSLIDKTPDELYARRLCENHFLESDYILPNKNGRLKPTAIPTHYKKGHISYSKIQNNTAALKIADTDSSPNRLTVSEIINMPTPPTKKKRKLNFDTHAAVPVYIPDTPRKRKLKAHLVIQKKLIRQKNSAIYRLSSKVKNLRKFREGQNFQFSSPYSKAICRMQFEKKRRTWTLVEKKMALEIYLSSSSTYKLLRRLGIVLPGVSTVLSWLTKLKHSTGFNSKLLEGLQNKFKNESERVRSCSLLIDEMVIKQRLEYLQHSDYVSGFQDYGELGRSSKVAKYALVLMARGIYKNWKVPIAYFLSEKVVQKRTLSEIIRIAIEKLESSSLIVKAVVCDQGSNNQGAYNILGANDEHPHFNVAGKKVFALYDVPHLIKSLRNNLLNGDFIDKDENVIRFEDIRKTYRIDEKSDTARSLVKLTESHIDPQLSEKMSVKKAVQVFSNSMGSAMETCIKTGQLNSDTAANTAKFVRFVNNLFDALNSRVIFDKNPYRCALTATLEKLDGPKDREPMKILKLAIPYFETITKVLHSKETPQRSRPPCFSGLVQTIRGILQLFQYENENNGITFICTNRLNQDPLENLFSIFRHNGGYNVNPTARTLSTSFRSSFTSFLYSDRLIPAGTNCEPDRDHFLENFDFQNGTSTSTVILENTEVDEEEDDGDEDDPDEKIPSEIGNEDEDENKKNVEENHIDDGKSTLEKCAISYFAGYEIHYLKKKLRINCDICNEAMEATFSSDAPDPYLIQNKTYENIELESGKGLRYPAPVYTAIFTQILTKFSPLFKKFGHEKNVCQKIASEMKKNDSISSWLHSGHENHRLLLLNSTIKCKIFYTTKNLSIVDSRKKRRKLAILANI